ncbi:hypothetical protein BGZ93_011345 [Podila epicladia]|nr:hypothetical protein BGZ93_011345 [Podila epicladia]
MENSFQFQDQQDHRRALAEDHVSYAIFLAPTAAPGLDGGETNGTHSAQESTVSLESLHIAKALIISIVSDLAKDYIWHQDAFSLRDVSGKGKRKEYTMDGYLYLVALSRLRARCQIERRVA